jgi:hypothetical protein
MYGIGKLIENSNDLLMKLIYGTSHNTRVIRFSDRQDINLTSEGKGKGVKGFTLRNIGSHIIYVSTSPIGEKEPVHPQNSWSIGQDALVKGNIIIDFDDAEDANYNTDEYAYFRNKGKQGLVRFLVEDC